MAYYHDHKTYSLIERLLARMAKGFEDAAVRHAHHRVYRTSLAELRSLSARDLADIGLNRSMLKIAALEAADRHMAR